MKLLKSKMLHIGTACLAATVCFSAPMSVGASTAEPTKVSAVNGVSKYVTKTVYYPSISSVKQTYSYNQDGYRGTLQIDYVEPAGRGGVNVIYSGTVSCYGNCPI